MLLQLENSIKYFELLGFICEVCYQNLFCSHLKDYVSYKKYHKKPDLQHKKKKEKNNHTVRVITHGVL